LCGSFTINCKDPINCDKIRMPNGILNKLDTINRYAEIITDDIFSAHAAIALRKKCTFISNLPYRMEFFGKGGCKKVSQ